MPVVRKKDAYAMETFSNDVTRDVLREVATAFAIEHGDEAPQILARLEKVWKSRLNATNDVEKEDRRSKGRSWIYYDTTRGYVDNPSDERPASLPTPMPSNNNFQRSILKRSRGGTTPSNGAVKKRVRWSFVEEPDEDETTSQGGEQYSCPQIHCPIDDDDEGKENHDDESTSSISHHSHQGDVDDSSGHVSFNASITTPQPKSTLKMPRGESMLLPSDANEGGVMRGLQEIFHDFEKDTQSTTTDGGEGLANCTDDGTLEDNQENEEEEEDPIGPGDLLAEEDLGFSLPDVLNGESTDYIVCKVKTKPQEVKNQWTMKLTDGLMTLNGKSYYFREAAGSNSEF